MEKYFLSVMRGEPFPCLFDFHFVLIYFFYLLVCLSGRCCVSKAI